MGCHSVHNAASPAADVSTLLIAQVLMQTQRVVTCSVPGRTGASGIANTGRK